MGNRPAKNKCLNCDNGNHTSTAKSYPERKRIINRRNKSKSRNQCSNQKTLFEKEEEEINGIEMETIETFKTEIIEV